MRYVCWMDRFWIHLGYTWAKGFMTVPSMIAKLLHWGDYLQVVSLLVSTSMAVAMLVSLGQDKDGKRICALVFMSIYVVQCSLFFLCVLSLGWRLNLFLKQTHDNQTSLNGVGGQRSSTISSPLVTAMNRIDTFMKVWKWLVVTPVPAIVVCIWIEGIRYAYPAMGPLAVSVSFVMVYTMKSATEATAPQQTPSHARQLIVAAAVATTTSAAGAASHVHDGNEAMLAGARISNNPNIATMSGGGAIASPPQQPRSARGLAAIPITTLDQPHFGDHHAAGITTSPGAVVVHDDVDVAPVATTDHHRHHHNGGRASGRFDGTVATSHASGAPVIITVHSNQ
jgi:hypothetical protein